MTPREVTSPQNTTTLIPSGRGSVKESTNHVSEIEDSMTPPLSIRATSIPGEELLDESEVKGKDEEATTTTATKVTTTAKKNEWDMFAEQDLDSNFDVRGGTFYVLKIMD